MQRVRLRDGRTAEILDVPDGFEGLVFACLPHLRPARVGDAVEIIDLDVDVAPLEGDAEPQP